MDNHEQERKSVHKYHYHSQEEHEFLHAHGIAHHHGHGHVHENQRAVINRLARAIGHLEKVKRMVEEGYDCSEVLIQLAAVRSALDNTGKVILKDHMRHCMVDAVAAGDMEAISPVTEQIWVLALRLISMARPIAFRPLQSLVIQIINYEIWPSSRKPLVNSALSVVLKHVHDARGGLCYPYIAFEAAAMRLLLLYRCRRG